MPISFPTSTIKTYFQTGDKPTQGQFYEWIDALADGLSSASDYGKVGFINLLEYGCAGDGVTDDTSLINQALSEALIVYAPYTENGYKITNQININYKNRLFSFGGKIFTDDQTHHVIYFTNGAHFSTLDGLELTQNANINNYNAATWVACIQSGTGSNDVSDDVTIRNCYIHGTGRIGIYNATGGSRWKIQNNRIYETARDGIHMGSSGNLTGANAHTITGNTMYLTGDDAITLAGRTRHSTVSGNAIYFPGQHNPAVGGSGIRNNGLNNQITGNSIYFPSVFGIVDAYLSLDLTQNTDLGTIVGNGIYGLKPLNSATMAGIAIQGVDNVIVSGNTVDVQGGYSATITGCANNGSGLIRVTCSGGHDFITGVSVRITGVVGTTEANGRFVVTRISSTQFDLDGSAFVNPYTSGGSAVLAMPAMRVYGAQQTASLKVNDNIFRNCEAVCVLEESSVAKLYWEDNQCLNYNTCLDIQGTTSSTYIGMKGGSFDTALNAGVLRFSSGASSVSELDIINIRCVNSTGVPVQFNSRTVSKCRMLNNDFGSATTVYNNAGSVTNFIYDGNHGLVMSNQGTATVPNGSTSVDVTHGLGFTPAADQIRTVPTNNLGSASHFWLSNIGATTFRINTDVDPGATTATFSWSASYGQRKIS